VQAVEAFVGAAIAIVVGAVASLLLWRSGDGVAAHGVRIGGAPGHAAATTQPHPRMANAVQPGEPFIDGPIAVVVHLVAPLDGPRVDVVVRVVAVALGALTPVAKPVVVEIDARVAGSGFGRALVVARPLLKLDRSADVAIRTTRPTTIQAASHRLADEHAAVKVPHTVDVLLTGFAEDMGRGRAQELDLRALAPPHAIEAVGTVVEAGDRADSTDLGPHAVTADAVVPTSTRRPEAPVRRRGVPVVAPTVTGAAARAADLAGGSAVT
jgi:hypothetical protein